MRGRTLNDSFIILDEAQNTTPEQMKMFLTRLGFGSKTVVTGDVTQVDLPGGDEVRTPGAGDPRRRGRPEVLPPQRQRRGPPSAGGEIVVAYDEIDAAQRAASVPGRRRR